MGKGEAVDHQMEPVRVRKRKGQWEETKEEGGEGDRDKEEMARLRTHMPHEQTSLSEEESHLCGCLKLTGSRNLKPLLVGEEEGW